MPGELAVTQRNEVTEEPRYIAYHWAVILATPFLLLAINPNLFINPNTNVWIDAWVNTGFFLSLPDHLLVWGHSYYSTRLSWLLPGYAAHQIFSPFLANYVLHFGFFYVLLSAVYCLVTAGTNRTTAFIVTLLVAWNPQVIAAMSWDYVDGAVITYFIATLLFIEKASSSAKHWTHWAVAVGAGLTCMVVANLVAATLVPICGLFLLLRVSLPHWRRAGVIVLIAAVGGVATLAILAHTNWQLGGNWLFLKPSVSYASTRVWVASPWDVQGMSWLADAHVLVLPAAASLAALLALWNRPWSLYSFTGAVQLTFLVAAAWWLIHSSLWTHSIHISYYTSYLVPLGLIALVLVPDSPLATSDTPRRHVALTTELATICVLVAAHLLVFRWGNLFWAASSSALAVTFPAAPPFNTITAFAICAVTLLLNRFARSRWLAWPAFLLTLWIAYSSVPMNWATADTPHLKEDFALTVSTHRYLWAHLDNNRRLSMWYALPPGERRPFRNIASTYLWAWMYVNEDLPSLSEREAASLTPGAQLVLLVPDLADTDRARGVLRTFEFDYTVREQKQFGPADATFWVVIGDLFQTQAASH